MTRKQPRRKLSEITNIQTIRTLKKCDEPEACIIHPEESIADLDVVDIPLEDGVFGDYQVECPREFNLYSSHF
ncbi:hypothetical protein KMI_08g13360 [Encephalitozoon hellem]|nr:hypothetical protein KMI_08g13360 [Encephalitozoon hellem]